MPNSSLSILYTVPICWLAALHPLMSAEITGRVVDVEDKIVEVLLAGEHLPKAGDKAEILYRIPGTNIDASAATGKVAAVGKTSVSVTISKSTSTIQEGFSVKITTDSLEPMSQRRTAPIEHDDWSMTISKQTWESEISAIHQELGTKLATYEKFRAGDYKDVRRYFSELAVLFAIADEYIVPHRFKGTAAVASERFGRAANNCKVGSRAAFDEANQRKSDLDSILSGGRLAGEAAERSWEHLSDRGPLMQRMKLAVETLSEQSAHRETFPENRNQIHRHAEVVAAIAKVLQQPGYYDAEEPEYAGHAERLHGHARSLASASAEARSDFEAVADSLNSMKATCARCHADWR